MTTRSAEPITRLEVKSIGIALRDLISTTFQGQITKYVERWKKKNGLQDLLKARHFLDKYIELEELRDNDRVRNVGDADRGGSIPDSDQAD